MLNRWIVVTWLICVDGEMRLLPPHIQLCVCVGLCMCVYVHVVEYNTAMLNPNQWIWLQLVNLKPLGPSVLPLTPNTQETLTPPPPPTQTILMVYGWAGRGGCALAASQHGRLEVRMAAGVLNQVVAAHEALIAQWAQEAFLPCVGASVAGQLIRAGKLLLAVGPGAREGPLTCSMETEN